MPKANADRQNVLFVVIDQFRADCLFGALAHCVDLPNLRALMADAVGFDNNYSVCAPCGPSRTSILTGQYAMNHRAVRNGTPLRHDTPNLATEARKRGYLPLLFGYSDSAGDPRRLHPGDPALRSYEEVMPGFHEALRMRLEDDIGPWRADLVAKGYDVAPFPDLYRPVGPAINDPAIYSVADSDTAFLTDRVIGDLSIRPKGWFAHVTYIRPHPPFVAPAPYNRMYDPVLLPRPLQTAERDARAWHPFIGPALERNTLSSTIAGGADIEPSDANIALVRSIYLGLATEVDHHIGRLISFLRETGQYDDTLIVVTSDHGEMLGDYFAWGKSTFYDAAFHTALIIRDPARNEMHGTRVQAPTESVDLTPTILDIIGAEIPHSMDGHSLRPLLEGRAVQWRDCTVSELEFGNPVNPTIWQKRLGLTSDQTSLAILRTATHRLVHFGADLPQVLFDMRAEGEARDVSELPENASICLDLTRKMLCHRMNNPEGTFARTMVTPGGVRVGRG